MKPTYLNKKLVPQEVKDKHAAEGDKALWKFYNSEVFMEQDLATSDESMKVKALIRAR